MSTEHLATIAERFELKISQKLLCVYVPLLLYWKYSR